jgi:hypothetical protein
VTIRNFAFGPQVLTVKAGTLGVRTVSFQAGNTSLSLTDQRLT